MWLYGDGEGVSRYALTSIMMKRKTAKMSEKIFNN